MVASEAVNVEQEMESQAAILAASSSTQLKWAPIVMLGPLLPTMLAVVTIVVGEFVVKADVIDTDADISCGYPIDDFVTLALVNSYLLLLVFGWSFLGFETEFTVRGRTRRFLRPFSSLGFLALTYFLLFLMSIAVWILGTWAVVKGMEGNVCPATNPVLYSFSLFLVVAYWLGFLFGAIALVGTLFGKQIKSKAQASLEKAANYAENRDKAQLLRAEEQLVSRKFDALDTDGSGTIGKEQAEKLIEELGRGQSSKQLKKAMANLDPQGDGIVAREDFMSWYKEHGQTGG